MGSGPAIEVEDLVGVELVAADLWNREGRLAVNRDRLIPANRMRHPPLV